MIPSVFVTAAHHHAGLKRDAASVWIDDVTQSSFKVCLRELQNYAGSHEDLHVVSASVPLSRSFIYLSESNCVESDYRNRDFEANTEILAVFTQKNMEILLS